MALFHLSARSTRCAELTASFLFFTCFLSGFAFWRSSLCSVCRFHPESPLIVFPTDSWCRLPLSPLFLPWSGFLSVTCLFSPRLPPPPSPRPLSFFFFGSCVPIILFPLPVLLLLREHLKRFPFSVRSCLLIHNVFRLVPLVSQILSTPLPYLLTGPRDIWMRSSSPSLSDFLLQVFHFHATAVGFPSPSPASCLNKARDWSSC